MKFIAYSMLVGLLVLVPIKGLETEKIGLSDMPSEIHAMIISSLAHAKDLDQAIKSIHRLAQTNTYFNNFIEKDRPTNNALRKALSKFTNNNEFEAAAALGTVASIEWLKSQKGLDQLAIHITEKPDQNLIARGLLQAGVDPNKPDKSGTIPIIQAVTHGNVPFVKMLLDAKADPDKQGSRGYTALMVAVEKGNAAIIKLLLDAKADLNKPNQYGATPLLLAVRAGHTSIAEMLLAAKADPNKQTRTGMTALKLANEKGLVAMVKLLEQYGATR